MRLSAPTLANITHCGVASAGLLAVVHWFSSARPPAVRPGQLGPAGSAKLFSF